MRLPRAAWLCLLPLAVVAQPKKPDAPPVVTTTTLPPSLKKRIIALGWYVLAIGGDDSYTGKSRLDFLLYAKVLPWAEDLWYKDPFTWECNASAYQAKPPRNASVVMDTSVTGTRDFWFPNAVGNPTISPCPKGAAPLFGGDCWLVAGDFLYESDLSMFPFEDQQFLATLEDNGPPQVEGNVTRFCYMGTMMAISAHYAQVTAVTANQQLPSLIEKCYPPYNNCEPDDPTCTETVIRDLDDECDEQLEPRRLRYRIRFSVAMDRPKRKAFLRYFLVPSVILLLIFGIYLQDPVDDLQTRRTTVAGLFWTTTGFHFTAVVLSPAALRSRQLSYIDSYMTYLYTVIIMTMLFHGFVVLRKRRRDALGPDDKPTKEFRKYMKELNKTMVGWIFSCTLFGLLMMLIANDATVFLIVVITEVCGAVPVVYLSHHRSYYFLEVKQHLRKLRRRHTGLLGEEDLTVQVMRGMPMAAATSAGAGGNGGEVAMVEMSREEAGGTSAPAGPAGELAGAPPDIAPPPPVV